MKHYILFGWVHPQRLYFFMVLPRGTLESCSGGLVFSLDRLSTFSFSWGLGSICNNQAKSYSLLLASQLVKEKWYKSVQIYGDSELLIKALNSADSLNNSALNSIPQRIRIILKVFDKSDSFHILWDQNKLADALANKACLLPQGFLSINEEPSYFHPIP